MQNEGSIEQTLISLYDQLHNNSPTNTHEITDALLSIYALPAAIPALLSLMQNSNSFIKIQACIGLKLLFKNFSDSVDPNQYTDIWTTLFALAMNELNPDIFEILLLPMIEMFARTHGNWKYIHEFISKAIETNPRKGLQIVSSFLPYLNLEYLIQNESYFCKIIEFGLSLYDKLSTFGFTFLVFYEIAHKFILENQQLYETFTSKFSESFSILLSEFISKEEEMKYAIQCIHFSLEFKVNPFQLPIVIQSIFASLQNPRLSMPYKYVIAAILAHLISQDKSSTINDETFKEIIPILLSVSIEMFNQSNDINDPDSYIFAELFTAIFEHLSIKSIHTFISPIINEYLASPSPANIYNVLLLFDSYLSQTDDSLYEQINQVIVPTLVACFQSDHPALRYEASWIFVSHSIISQSLDPESRCEIITLLLDIITKNNTFYYGLKVILELVQAMQNTDCLFERLLPFCFKLIDSGMDVNKFGWNILISLFELSDNAPVESFEQSISYCLRILNTQQSDGDDISSSIKCIAALMSKSIEVLIQNIESLNNIFLSFFQNQNLETKYYILTTLTRFVSIIPNEMSEYLPPFLDTCFTDLIKFDSISMVSQGLYNFYVLTPELDLIRQCLISIPKYFSSRDTILQLCSVLEKNLSSVLTQQLHAALQLFNQFIAFSLTIGYNLFSINQFFLLQIIEKLKSEINELIISDFFDVLNTAISNYGFQFLQNYTIIQLIELIFSKISFENDSSNHALQLLNTIIQNLKEPDQETIEAFQTVFIGPLIQNLDQNPSFSLTLFSQIVVSTNQFMTQETLATVTQKSLENIINLNQDTIICSVIFINSLMYHYKNVLAQISSELIDLIKSKIPLLNAENDEELVFREYFVTLLMILDLNCCSVTDEAFMKSILSYLPVRISQYYNNKHVYLYLLKRYDMFPSFQFAILRLFVNLFVNLETIKHACLPCELYAGILQILLRIRIFENPQLISQLFNGDDDKASSCIQTLLFFASKFYSQ